ncbi:ARM repeat superfamily protein putative isoform 3 [Tripterygium wilfordii]|uniref:ARM repeat superfamily protein putative isoform 3 n=1 Tax=Tripterygium wilfordii TaxID=458696 RepID=A0A7J7BY23_TRIWF|nr:TORTIFOLIA1-like protein 4 [Tripterygium wilfordii]KAF5726782.1 ARM repeat superfamily protein putative isoform 3 [Tripterygium wilfordii]
MPLHTKPSTPPPSSTTDLRHRVLTSLNKLSDRDTLALATSELESIARTLRSDSFSPFLNCLHTIDSSSRSPVRTQCVNLLTVMITSHGNSLSPHLPKIVSTVQRRLRDSDSSVRSACVDACTAMSAQITSPPFSVISKPLIESLVVEQDLNSQVGAAMCLAAAIEVAPEPETEQLRKLLPRLGKLMRSQGFKAKAAVLGVIRSVVGVGGATSKGILDALVPCVVEFLSSEDWTARKAAAEALEKLAVAERELAKQYKAACMNALESRRFDKVKVVRETMNHTLELWKEIPGIEELQNGLPPSQSRSSSSANNAKVCSLSMSKRSDDGGLKTPPQKKTIPTNRSPPSDSFVTTAKRSSTPLSTSRSSNATAIRKLNHNKSSEWKIEITGPQSPSLTAACEDNFKRCEDRILEPVDNVNNENSTTQTKQVLFSSIRDDKMHKFGGLRSGSRVVPFNDNHCSDVVSNDMEEVYSDQKDAEDLSLIREQLVQIENQQSSLLDLLQRFIGSSRSGINSLETRVHGLEKALDEISYDLAVSHGRIPNPESSENICCKLPGAEFLSPKLWRRTGSRYSTSRYCSSGSMIKEASSEIYKLDGQSFHHRSREGFIMNPLADDRSNSSGNSAPHPNFISKGKITDVGTPQFLGILGLDGASSLTCTAP